MASLNHSTIIKGFEKLIDLTDPIDFFSSFLKALKFSTTTIKRLMEPNSSRNVALTLGDFALTKQIYFHPAPVGTDLQAELRPLLNDGRLAKHQIRFFLATDFEEVVAYDRRVDDWTSFTYRDFRENYEFFLPLTGLYEKPLVYTEHPADVKACDKMGRLYDVIRAQNHYDKNNLHHLNVFLTRLLFCFFAEDTGIFPKPGQLTDAIESITQTNGSDMADFFDRLFKILDTPSDHPDRKKETIILSSFPHVNGGLFREKIQIPNFNERSRKILLECAHLTWSEISPVIFGSMFQAVMDPNARHERGAHYTSEKNIFKVIGPLFLDDLKNELKKLLTDKSTHKIKKLKEFQTKLASLRFLDPACGCGNFLIVTFRELKKIELIAAKEIYKKEQESLAFFDLWKGVISQVSINQFYGIEIEEFPVDIARVSMWLMEHVTNTEFSKSFGENFPSIPLKDSANIICANALREEWSSLLPIDNIDYIFGNPPFVGRPSRTEQQQEDLAIWVEDIQDGANLDYVCGWYLCAAQWMLRARHRNIKAAFVSTNSICQGEQVIPLWRTLFTRGIEIDFAHQTFKWSNESKNVAAVYCIIVGFSASNGTKKKLYKYKTVNSEPTLHYVKQINGLLLDFNKNLFVEKRDQPFQPITAMVLGNQATDDGNLIVENDEYQELQNIPDLVPYLKKYIGSKELIRNLPRHCLWLVNAPSTTLQIPVIAQRLDQCREFRQKSKKSATQKATATPHLFQDRRFDTPPSSAIVIPRVSSERREYLPIGFVGRDVIVSDSCYTIPLGTLYEFAILESKIHMSWMRAVCGRLKSDYRYSRDLCFNTFPLPKISPSQKKIIENLAQTVLMIRESYPEKNLAELYDPDKMPSDLRQAHLELDLAIERLYRKRPFESDEDRLHHLFARYEKLVTGEDDTCLFNEDSHA